jgi:hypothetical protein
MLCYDPDVDMVGTDSVEYEMENRVSLPILRRAMIYDSLLCLTTSAS